MLSDETGLDIYDCLTVQWVIKFNGLSGDSGQQGPYSPYKLFLAYMDYMDLAVRCPQKGR